jgi:hypothetical protein
MSQVSLALEHVQLLTNEKTIKVFNEMAEYSSKLRDILADNQVGPEDLPQTKTILEKMIGFLKSPAGKNFYWRENIKILQDKPKKIVADPSIQLLFQNLALHKDVIQILQLPQVDLEKSAEMREIYSLAYTFISYVTVFSA